MTDFNRPNLVKLLRTIYKLLPQVSRLIPRDLTHAVSDPRMPFFATPYNLIQKKKLNGNSVYIKGSDRQCMVQ